MFLLFTLLFMSTSSRRCSVQTMPCCCHLVLSLKALGGGRKVFFSETLRSVNTLWVWLFCQTFYGLKLSSESSLWSHPCCTSSALPSPLSFLLNELRNSALVIWCMTNMYLMTVYIGFKQVQTNQESEIFQFTPIFFSQEHSIMLYINTLPFNLFCLNYCGNLSRLLVCSSSFHLSTKAYGRQFMEAAFIQSKKKRNMIIILL